MTLTVLITTSGTGSRLNNLTKNTNKSLVKLGDKYAICYITEKYPSDSDFIITLGYFGSYVKQFLKLAYPSHKFTFIEIDKYEGAGSSLGYSLLHAKAYLNKPFIFHCCDAIVKDPVIFDPNKNTLCVAQSESNSQYASVLVEENYVKILNNKGSSSFNFVYTGISYIKDYSQFWVHLERLYKTDPNNSALSDVHSIQKMLLDGNEFTYNLLEQWFDTGNLESYSNASKEFKSNYIILEKDYESICFFEDSVIKFINDAEINRKRKDRGLNLYPLSPQITSYSDNFIAMQKINGYLLSEYYIHGEIYKLLSWANKNLWIDPKTDPTFKHICQNFYIKKTLSRISSLKIAKEYNIINGIKTKNIKDTITLLDPNLITTDIFTKFHGDFILDNILKTSQGYCLLDWRHEFDNQLYYGDPYYDMAKLRHNIIFNHDNINNDLYTVKYESDDSVIVDLKCNYFLIQQLSDFDRFATEQNLDLRKIKLLTAIIWINMAPLYEGKLQEFLFYFGKYNLQFILDS